MPLPPKTANSIIAEIRKRLPVIVCPLCQRRDWTIPSEGFSVVQLQDQLEIYNFGGPSMLLMPISCNTCGNTHFINLLTIGLGDLLKGKPETK